MRALFQSVTVVLATACVALGHSTVPEEYNVVWRSPSKDHTGTMPLGNGDIGVNAFIEPNGDLVFYVSKTDAWSDNGRLVKVGRVRIALDPAPATTSFLQTLLLQQGTLECRFGEGTAATTLRLWVDANHPAIEVTLVTSNPTTATASIELWRTEPYPLPALEVSDLMEDRSKPNRLHQPVIVEPDTVLSGLKGGIGWLHHNTKSVGPATIAEIQGLAILDRRDPLLHRTFGAVITTPIGERVDDTRLRSPSAKSHRYTVHVLTKHPASPQEWRQSMDETISATECTAFSQRQSDHLHWWGDFWNRSWIHVTPSETSRSDDALEVSRAYALQRYIDACAGRGRYPIKFNGSIFTVPHEGDPDYRRWGPGYWWQNTRLPYLSMCMSGDAEMMRPLFRMYAVELMPLHKYRTKIQCGHDGAFIPECIYFWGDQFTSTYGWTPFAEREDKLQESGWHKWEWVSGLELTFMMLDYYEYTLDEAFLKEVLLPTAHEVLTFFDQHYGTDDNGRLAIYPSMACETWWDCTNPMPEVAGLHAVTKRLLALPEGQTTDTQRRFWRRLNNKLPELPTRRVEGKLALAPAERFADKRNVENPELYAVFPFRLVSFEKPNAPLGFAALRHRWDKGSAGWRQDDLFMAYLGQADDARECLVARAKNKHEGSRFPAFWGPNYDWVPDQDHGGVLMKTLQAMLIQTEGKKIHLLPAWPNDWDASFKLHAPFQTVVEGEVRNGEIRNLSIAPRERRIDIVFPSAED